MGVILADGRPIQTVHAIQSDGLPRLAVTPDVGGSPQAKQEFGDGSNELRYLRATVNAGDDIVAGARLLNGYPDATMLLADGQYVFMSDSAITRVDIVAIGDALSGSLAAGELLDEAGTESEASTAMVTFTFGAADNVRTVIVTVSQIYNAANSSATQANWVMAHVEGRSHA